MPDEHVDVDPQHSQVTEFTEEGELIQMEINDGGAAAAEFASEDEEADSDESKSEQGNSSSDEEDLVTDDDHPMETEDKGDDPQSEGGDTELDEAQTSFEVANSPNNSPARSRKDRKQRKREKRKSMEDKIESMSNAIIAMQDLFVQSGMLGQAKGKVTAAKGTTEGPKLTQANHQTGLSSHSETTIYQNVLEKVGGEAESIDEEISFKLPGDGNESKQRDSTSSEDRIDTSDELMEVVLMNNSLQIVMLRPAECDKKKIPRGG